MQERFFASLTEGMDVYDTDGDKVGTVGKVLRRTGVAAPSTAAPTSYAEPTSGEESCFKVDTGFLGLGKDLFIPVSAVADVSGDRVILNVNKDRLDDRGWDHRPAWITDDML